VGLKIGDPMNSRKELKNKLAQERNELWRKLTPEQQLKELDLRLGIGIGATRQRAKIISKNTKDE
jgi:hypothetical protein